ncbi:AMP-binding protein [Streptomyces sp. NPDC093707]|uniref:AMP-binding protein n=1 Tax=Streptomyces sp. NPDC093707 TaxID=3154984 RepID=UPI00344ECDDB
MLLDWLMEARSDRGVRFLADNGEWRLRSYKELSLDVRRTACALRAAGGRPQDVAVIVTGDPEEFITAFNGALAAGMVPSPLAPPTAFRSAAHYERHLSAVMGLARPALVCGNRTVEAPLMQAVEGSGGSAVFVDVTCRTRPDGAAEQAADGPDALPVRRAPEDLALLQFTSGASGAPKAVRVSWANLAANIAAIRSRLRWSERDVFASWLPLHRDMGLIGGMLAPVVSGTDLWLMTPRQFVRSPRQWLACFGVHGATLTAAPSSGYAHAVRTVRPAELAGMDFSRWRAAVVGAERIDPAVLAGFQRLVGPHGLPEGALIGAYGLAENTLVATGASPGGGSRLVRVENTLLSTGDPVAVAECAVLGRDGTEGGGWLVSCGRPVDGTRLSIVDGDGRELPPGTFGEIRLSGDSLARGYLAEDGTAAFGPEGLRTGDAGFELAGEVYVAGRIAEALNVRGALVPAEEVEAELAALDRSQAHGVTVAFGTAAGAGLAAVFVEGELPECWPRNAAQRVGALTSSSVDVVVLQGGRGSIVRTSNGTPRRRLMWEQLRAPRAAARWRLVHGSLPLPLHPAPGHRCAPNCPSAECGCQEAKGVCPAGGTLLPRSAAAAAPADGTENPVAPRKEKMPAFPMLPGIFRYSQ